MLQWGWVIISITVCVLLCRTKSFIFSGLYAAIVFGGQHFMRERQRLNLRRPLVLWSLSLAIFRWVTLKVDAAETADVTLTLSQPNIYSRVFQRKVVWCFFSEGPFPFWVNRNVNWKRDSQRRNVFWVFVWEATTSLITAVTSRFNARFKAVLQEHYRHLTH